MSVGKYKSTAFVACSSKEHQKLNKDLVQNVSTAATVPGENVWFNILRSLFAACAASCHCLKHTKENTQNLCLVN